MNTSLDSLLVRQLSFDDLDSVVALQRCVTAGLPSGFIRAKSASELTAFLDGTRGVTYGISDGTTLLAMSLLRMPTERHPNSGEPFPLVPESDWPLHACFLENTMVHARARGMGLQRLLHDVRTCHAALADMKWICAGVHLSNSVSWANLLAKGMAIAGVRVDPGYPVIGLLSGIDETDLPSDPGNCISVCAHDHAQHQAALADGYIGVRLTRAREVIYQHLESAAHSSRRAVHATAH